jgi:hypothetical protein
MAVVGNELVTSVGNTLCAWDLRQLSAGAFLFPPACEKAIQIVARAVEVIRRMFHLTLPR